MIKAGFFPSSLLCRKHLVYRVLLQQYDYCNTITCQYSLCYTTTIGSFLGEDLFHDGLSSAYKFIVALISANLRISPKTKCEERAHQINKKI